MASGFSLKVGLLVGLVAFGLGCASKPTLRPPQSEQTNELVDGLEFLKHYKAWDFDKKPLTLGIELEAVAPKTSSPTQMIGLVMEQLQAHHPKALITAIKLNSLEYKTSATSPTYKYQVIRDNSINPPEGFHGVELVSPILRTPQDVAVFYKIVDALKTKAGLLAAPMSAGVHVHIGFPDSTSEELNLLAWLFHSIEVQVHKSFKTLLPRLKWANYTSSTVQSLYKEKNKQLRQQPKPLDYKKPQENDFLKPAKGKYYGLNFTPLKTLGTIEFRFANSSTTVPKIKNFVNFTKGLVQAVRSKDPRLTAFLKQHQNATRLPLAGLVAALELDVDFSQFDYEDVKNFFKKTGSINTVVNKQGNNHLVEAVFSGDAQLVEVLLELGASIDMAERSIRKINKQDNLLHRALMSGNHRVVELLIQYGLLAKKEHISTAIRGALYTSNRPMVQALLKANPHAANSQHLFVAIQKKDAFMVQALLKANPHAANSQHLFLAIQNKDHLVVQSLVDTGIEVSYSHLREATSLHAEKIIDIFIKANTPIDDKILSYAHIYAPYTIINKLKAAAAAQYQKTHPGENWLQKCWQLLSPSPQSPPPQPAN